MEWMFSGAVSLRYRDEQIASFKRESVDEVSKFLI